MTSSEYRKLSMLLTDIKNGSRDLFSEIFAMYENKAYFLCCKLLKSKTAAKKMTIDLFDYIYINVPSFGNASVFEKWLYNNLFVKCRRYLIENSPEDFGDYIDTDSQDGNIIDAILAEDSDEMVDYPDGIDVSVDMMQIMDSILSEMPLKLRTVTLMYYFCGLDQNEIASTEQISVMAVKNRLYKAHIRLKTEEHKYSEMGFDIAGAMLFLPEVLTTMAESIVIPTDIASGVTSRTGVNCMAGANPYGEQTDGGSYNHGFEPRKTDDSDATTFINAPAQKSRSTNYVTTSYASPVQAKKSFSQDISPAVKVLMAIVAILIIIGGTVAVVLAVQGRKPDDGGTVASAEEKEQPRTIEVTTKEKTTERQTTEATTEKVTETTTAATTEPPTTVPTTAAPETQPPTQPPTTAEPTTVSPEPEGGDNDIDNDYDPNFVYD